MKAMDYFLGGSAGILTSPDSSFAQLRRGYVRIAACAEPYEYAAKAARAVGW